MERSSSSSLSDSDVVEIVDWISKLPDDVLLLILSRLSTEEAVKTSVLSKRWEHVWKHMSHLVLDMRKITNSRKMLDVSNRVAALMTKIINNHRGRLESCVIDHYTNWVLEPWIEPLTIVKQTKHLTLSRHVGLMNCGEFIEFPPNTFSYPGLTSLSLAGYVFKTSHSFNNCRNLKTLNLLCMFAYDVGVFNRVLASCPSLEVLLLHINSFKKSGPLKIFNNRIKHLQLSSCEKIDGIEVSSTRLDTLTIGELSLGRDDFVLEAPRLRFYRNFWLAGRYFPHMSYNIPHEEKNNEHEEFMVNTSQMLKSFLTGSLSVSVDLKNPIEVERLRQVLVIWKSPPMVELEILFKNNNAPREEREPSKNKDVFPNVVFRVKTVWMHNFSGSVEEFAFASRLITQKTVLWKMMIMTTSFPVKKKLEIEKAVSKLQALRTRDQRELTIKCF